VSLRRFAIGSGGVEGDRVTFDREETRHMVSVLRLSPGDLVVAADGRGRDYTVRLESLAAMATGTIVGIAANPAEAPLAVTLVQGVPKGDKMEAIVRASTELGVARIWPALAERTVVRLEPARWRERSRRWQRVAREAAKQCGRAVVPDVETPRPLSECLQAAGPGSPRLCLWEGEAPPLADALDALVERPRAVAVLIGPEGGLARAEVDAARAVGWTPATLGPRILRTETAALAALAIVLFKLGDLGHAPAER
jgi:16S rRNA (uracil1498-N3)-methyltransferase